jgi:cobalamin synthase
VNDHPKRLKANRGDEQLLLATCQWRLATVRLVGAAVLFVIVLVQIAGGKYGQDDDKAWGWLLPNLLPTLSMISGAIVYQVKNQSTPMMVTRFAFRTTWWLSLIYLLLVLVTVLLVPLAEQMRNMKPIDWLTHPHALLTGLSTIVGGTLGAFFVSSRPQQS